MKKQLRKIALAAIFSMAAAMLAPAEQVALAAAATFTYAEQDSGDKVTTLFMDRGEKIDLKYLGVKNHTSYKKKWASSDEKVAVVDNNGLITALGEGTATIKLLVGDGKDYTSTGVLVHVGKTQEVTIGMAGKTEIKSCTLELGKSVALKANGIKDNVGDRYTFAWSSTDTSVAKVSNEGLLTAVAPGLAVVQLKVTKVSSGAVTEATPIAVLVTASGTSLPTNSPTPTPTKKPAATPTPTLAPNVTATPTPIPSNSSYSTVVTSDRSVTLTFKEKVSYTASDVEFSQVIEYGTEDFTISQNIESVELDITGKVMTVNLVDVMETGRYKVKVGSNDAGTTFAVTLGEPNRMELSYSCMGQENIAYAYNDSIGIDVPVTLSYKLYYNNIEVTETYANNGYTSFEQVSPNYSDNIMFNGDQIYFYAPGVSTSIKGTYTYYTNSGREIVLPDTVTISAKAMSDFKITGVANWTIIKSDSTEKIDWNKTVNSVVAGENGYKVVALLKDSYGNYYSTDDRGVDKAKNIYSINDTDTLFALKNYTFSFNPSNDNNFYIDGVGNLYTYAAETRAGVYVTLYNSSEYSSGEKNIGAWTFTILAESKLNSVVIEESNVTLLTQAVNNEERFCETDVTIKLVDQYGNPWKGEPTLDVTASVTALNNGASDVASISKGLVDGEWILHINAKSIKSYSPNTSSVTFTVKDYDTKKADSVKVLLRNPASNSSAGIVVGNWNVGMKEDIISYGNGNMADIGATAHIEIYQVSKNGGFNVGLFGGEGVEDENGKSTRVKIQESADRSFNSNCSEGDIFVLVLGPDGKMVEEVHNVSEVGVYQEADGSVSVRVTPSNSEKIEGLPEGKYTVRVTKINSISSNGYPNKLTKTTTFTVVDNTKDVTIGATKNNRRTQTSVYSEYDDAWKDIVLELFDFNLGGTRWTTLTKDMITDIEVTPQGTSGISNGVYKIVSIEFEIPAEGEEKITYKKKLKVNQTVYTGVTY